MKSLDPRVSRLPETGTQGVFGTPAPLDQFGTYEVFIQPKEGKQFQHEGIVHAPDLEMAFILAKETFTRRFTCVSLYVTATAKVYVAPTVEGNQNIWELIKSTEPLESVKDAEPASYEVYYLPKRGKQHVHGGTIKALSPVEAMLRLQDGYLKGKLVFNLWAIRTTDIIFTTEDEQDFWATLPEKKFRDAAEYKGGDKLKNFIDSTRHRTS